MSKRLTQKEFEEKFYSKYKDKYTVVGKYEKAIIPIDIKCNNCGYVFSRTPNSLDDGKACCPCCEGNKNTVYVIKGVNDIWTTHPEVAECLSNSEDGYKYRFNTEKKLRFTCPNCNSENIFRPNKYTNGFSCKFCGSSYSYPNKFMANILTELGVDFKTEYMLPGYPYKYDFYFKVNDKRYILEMDGGLNHGFQDNMYSTIEEQIEYDRIKAEAAFNEGYDVLRICCVYQSIKNRYKTISNNILRSTVGVLFNITDEILEKANNKALQSNVVLFSNYWNDGIYSYEKLSQKLHVSRSTIRDYAKISIDLGLIKNTYEDFLSIIRLDSNRRLAETKGRPVMCKSLNIAFPSVAEANRVTGKSVNTSLYKHDGKMLYNNEYIIWEFITKEEYKKYIEEKSLG